MDPETIDPLLSALPPSWLAAIEAYAPHVLAWGGLVLLLVHILLPLARRLEAWALATPDPRDDGPARRFREALEAIGSVGRAVLSWIPRLTIGDPERAQTPRHRAETMRPPPSDGALALVLVIVAAACSAALSGCSSGPQLPIVTVPMSISCSWHVPIGQVPERDASIVSPSSADGSAGVIVTDNDCTIDRSAASADPRTVGNDNRGVRVDPTTSVSGLGGTP